MENKHDKKERYKNNVFEKLKKEECFSENMKDIINKVDDIGQAASKAAQDKIEKYSKGVGEFGHEFIPLAMETTGHLDGKCFLFLKRCLTEVKFQEKLKFKHDFLGTISLALAQFRAQIILDVAARISLSYSDLMVITTN